ncbi:MAG: glycoside hydrolase family 20 protein [Bacteroidota bacterium]
MRSTFQLLLFISILLSSVFVFGRNKTLNIIPQPTEQKALRGSFPLNNSTSIIIQGSNKELHDLAVFFSEKIKLAGGPALQIINEKSETKKIRNAIYFSLTGADPALGKEGYELEVTKKGILLKANAGNGIFYGIQSLFQLMPPEVESTSNPSAIIWQVQAVRIKDTPRYSYRGMHLDCSRHFFPVDFVKKYIDLLSMYKMNTFHWHLTDDQGWRIEIKKYPKLTTIGAIRKGTQLAKTDETDNKPYGGFYSQDQVKEVVAYAAQRFVRVMPEIEMPGHSIAALAAYPKYSCRQVPLEIRTNWGVSDDVFCPGNDSTFIFIQDILTEVIALFPSEYIHVGGDECPKSQWAKCPKCQQRMKTEGLKNELELQSYFIKRIEKFLNEHGKKLVGWDEILEGGLPAQAAVMSWRGFEGGIEAAKQGHDVMMTPGHYCYFDHYQGDPSYEPLAIGGYTNLKEVYSFEPTPAELSPEQAKHIIGAQGNLWTEYIETPEHAEYMAYPRAIALAEVNWSTAKSRDWEDFTRRLKSHFNRLSLKKVNYAKSLYEVAINTIPGKDNKGMMISLNSDWKDMAIRYTLDNSDPTEKSLLFKEAFSLSKTSIAKAGLFDNEQLKSRISTKTILIHKAFGKPVTLLQKYSPKYVGHGDPSMVDGQKGTAAFRAGEWQGYEGNDLEQVIDLGEPILINKISAGFLKNIYSWIFFPVKVEFYISQDGKTFELAGTIEEPLVKGKGVDLKTFVQDLQGKSARYIKVHAVNPGVCPAWHEAAGQPCWIFADEIEVE